MKVENLIGSKVITRGIQSGVYFGILKSRDGKETELYAARNIWYWEGANNLMDIAASGINPKTSKVSRRVDSISITDVCEIIPCTHEAIKCIENIEPWEYTHGDSKEPVSINTDEMLKNKCGFGKGSGEGAGYGNGCGSGNGYDDGNGDGSGNGYGSGCDDAGGISSINGCEVLRIGGLPVVITKTDGLAPRGYILEHNLRLCPCIILPKSKVSSAS